MSPAAAEDCPWSCAESTGGCRDRPALPMGGSSRMWRPGYLKAISLDGPVSIRSTILAVCGGTATA